MPADDYLSSLIKPRANRRRPLGDVVDSLESAAQMDAMQRANVSGGSSASMEPMGDVGASVVQLMSGGGRRGGGVPVRTASQKSGDGGTTQTQCKPGMKCYQGGSTVGSGQQYFSQPQIISERVTHINGVPVGSQGQPRTTVSAPMPQGTTVSQQAPAQQSTTVESPAGTPQFSPPMFALPPGGGRINQMIDSAIANSASPETAPQAGASIAGAKVALAAEDLGNQNQQFWATFPSKEAAVRAATDATLADAEETRARAKATLAEAGLTEAQTAITAATNIVGITGQEAALGESIMRGDVSVESAVNAVMAQRQRTPVLSSTDDKKSRLTSIAAAPDSDLSDAGQRMQLRRQYVAMQAVGGLFQAEAINRHNAAGGQIDQSKVAGAVSDIFVSNLRESGAFESSWDFVDSLLRDDVRRPLVKTNVARYTYGIDPAKDPVGYNKAATQGMVDADTYFNFIRSRTKEAFDSHLRGQKPAAQSQAKFYGSKETVDSNNTLPKPPDNSEWGNVE